MKPRWSVVAVAFKDVESADQVLAITRHFDPKNLNLPGAHASAEDSSPEATLKRATLEKTGVHIRAFRLLSQWEGFFGEPVYAYRVTLHHGVPRSGSYGKAFWAKPEYLTTPTSTFAAKNSELIRKATRRGKT